MDPKRIRKGDTVTVRGTVYEITDQRVGVAVRHYDGNAHSLYVNAEEIMTHEPRQWEVGDRATINMNARTVAVSIQALDAWYAWVEELGNNKPPFSVVLIDLERP
jgi:type 1 fimbria pilin